MNTTTYNYSWFFVILPLLLIFIAAYFGTFSRFRYAKRIMEAQSRGAFKDMSTPDQKRKLRARAAIALIAMLGTFCSLGLLLLKSRGVIKVPIEIILVLLGISVLAGIIAGALMQREINRRL